MDGVGAKPLYSVVDLQIALTNILLPGRLQRLLHRLRKQQDLVPQQIHQIRERLQQVQLVSGNTYAQSIPRRRLMILSLAEDAERTHGILLMTAKLLRQVQRIYDTSVQEDVRAIWAAVNALSRVTINGQVAVTYYQTKTSPNSIRRK